jgi:hypothetical protein
LPQFFRGNSPDPPPVEVFMDALMNQLAKELSEAIAAAVTEDSRVEACREKARAAGVELRLSLEVVIGFVNRTGGPAVQKPVTVKKITGRHQDMTANDRRFLKSLRISADEPAEKEVE